MDDALCCNMTAWQVANNDMTYNMSTSVSKHTRLCQMGQGGMVLIRQWPFDRIGNMRYRLKDLQGKVHKQYQPLEH